MFFPLWDLRRVHSKKWFYKRHIWTIIANWHQLIAFYSAHAGTCFVCGWFVLLAILFYSKWMQVASRGNSKYQLWFPFFSGYVWVLGFVSALFLKGNKDLHGFPDFFTIKSQRKTPQNQQFTIAVDETNSFQHGNSTGAKLYTGFGAAVSTPIPNTLPFHTLNCH